MLGSMFVDAVTEEETWKDVLQGKKLSPIMFPQSVPSAVIGYVSKELNIHGPMSCMGADKWGAYTVLEQAADWLRDDAADIVLVTFCDVPSLRSKAWLEQNIPGHPFVGGVVSVTLEKTVCAVKRGANILMPIKQLYRLLSQEGVEYALFAGMAAPLTEGTRV